MRLFIIAVSIFLLLISIGCAPNVQGPSFTPTPEGQGWDFGCRFGMNFRSQTSPIKVNDRIFLALMEGRLLAFDAEKGKMIDPKTCSFAITQGIRSTPVEKDGVLYFGAFDKKLHGFDTKSCQEIFNFATNGYISSEPIIIDNSIYFGCYDGKFRSIDLTTRRLTWEYNCGTKIRGGAGQTSNGVVFGTMNGAIVHLDRQTGSEIWVYENGNEVYGSPAVSSDGLVIYGGLDGKVRALYEADGTVSWEYTPPDNGYGYKEEFWTSAIVDDKAAYIGSTFGRFYALKLRPSGKEGELVWEPFETKDKVGRGEFIFSEAVISGDNILFGCNDGKLYCIDRLTGTEKWSFTTFGEIRSKPLIDGDRVIFPSNDHYLYALSIADGAPVKGT